MKKSDIRWHQRFANYQKALAKLLEVTDKVNISTLSELEEEGLIQRFEYTYELAWKTLQDLLIEKGYADIKGPKPVLQQALKDGYITDEKGWRMLHEARNATSHTYNKQDADKIVQEIYQLYAPLFKALSNRLMSEASIIDSSLFS